MQEEKLEVEVKKQTWRDYETGEIYEDSADISYYKCQLLTQKYESITIGDFNSEGNYVIAREILEELVNANKYITDYENGTYHLVAKAANLVYELKFLLKITKKDSKMVATLSLSEIFGDLELNTDIARYKDDDNMYFLQKVAKVFHIVEKKDAPGKEEENENILEKTIGIIKKFIANKQAHVVFVNDKSKEYVEKIISKLKTKNDKFSKYVLKEYSRIVEDNKKHLGKINYYTKIRKALDKVINSSIKQCEDENLKKEIKDERKVFAEKVGANELAINTIAIATTKPTQKEDVKTTKNGQDKGDSGKKDKKGKGNDNDSKKKNGNGKEDTNKKKKKPFQNIIPKVFEIEAEKTVQPKVATESQVEKKEKAPSKGAEENIEEEVKNLNALLQNNFNLMNSYINKAKGELDKEVSNKVSEKTDVLNKGNFAMEVVNNQIDAVVAGIEQTEEVEEVLSQKTDKLEKRSENVLNL